MTKLSWGICIAMIVGDSSPSQARSPELENREKLDLPDLDSSDSLCEQPDEVNVLKLVTESLSMAVTEWYRYKGQCEVQIDSTSAPIDLVKYPDAQRLTLLKLDADSPLGNPDDLKNAAKKDEESKRRVQSKSELHVVQERRTHRARWDCWIPDPTCRRSIEVNATTAYAMRFVQIGSKKELATRIRHTALIAYEASLLFTSNTQALHRYKYSVFSLGPMGGIAASDAHDLWGSFGVVGRYWLGRGEWSPAIELHGLLNFKLRGSRGTNIIAQRSPIGFRGDLGINIGGWGAMIVGGEYQVPLITDGLPEGHHISAGGMFYAGFRGNILWGLPAATAVATHVLVNR